ncbi:MAG TPA: cytochrome c biogenesis protein ResB [Syntrophorhabdaceae bacterium]|nr:cytochrome c biogenesis protein ResB [Syntrophorhabdaceae bacterium]
MIATKNNPETSKDGVGAPLLHGIYRKASSIGFSITVLSLIAAASIVGTLIEQGATEEEYLSYYTEGVYRVVRLLGLDDVYHSFWFYTLLALFALNLILCTRERFTRFVRERRGDLRLKADRLEAMELSFTVPEQRSTEVMRNIKRAYRTLSEDDLRGAYEKGVLARLSVFIIHGSILVILAGGLIGHVFGFRASLALRIGEVRDRAITRDAGEKEIPLGFAIRCKDFKVNLYPNGTPKEYVTTVEILGRQKVEGEQMIRVNDPLTYNGMRFYQSSYGAAASCLFNVGGERVEARQDEVIQKENLVFKVVRYEEKVHGFGPGVEVAYLSRDEQRTTWFLLNVQKMKAQLLNGVAIELEKIKQEPFTVLEVVRDPGVYLVWMGFALLIVGLFVNFFGYYRRIYVARIKDGIVVAGYAAKNREAFEKEFERLKEVTDAGTP